MARILGTAIAVALATVLPHIALAQSDKAQDRAGQSRQAEVKKSFESAGFTDLKIEPYTLVVQANDPAASAPELESQETIEPSSRNSETGQAGKPSETLDDEQTTGSLGELNGDYTPTLTPAQKQVIWQNLSSEKTMRANKSKDYAPRLGATVPDGVSVQSLPDDIANDAPGLKGYQYAMLKNEIVIIHPASKKIVDIIKEQ